MKTLITFVFAVLVSSSAFAGVCGPTGSGASTAGDGNTSTLQEPAGDNEDLRRKKDS